MKAGEELKFNGKTYLATLNLAQIFQGQTSCKGCSIKSAPSILECPLEQDSGNFLCGGTDKPTDEQIIIVEKV